MSSIFVENFLTRDLLKKKSKKRAVYENEAARLLAVENNRKSNRRSLLFDITTKINEWRPDPVIKRTVRYCLRKHNNRLVFVKKKRNLKLLIVRNGLLGVGERDNGPKN